MRKLLSQKRLAGSFLTILVLLALVVNAGLPWARADEYEELEREKQAKLEEKKRKEEEAERVAAEQGTVKQKLTYTVKQIDQTETEIESKKKEILSLDQEITQGREAMAAKQGTRVGFVRQLYKNGRRTILELFFGLNDFSSLAQVWGYHWALLTEGHRQLTALGQEVGQLAASLDQAEKKKVQLTGEVASLETVKGGLTIKKSELENQQQEIQLQVNELNTQIAGITSRQQAILEEKLGSFTTSVGEVPPPDDNPPPHFAGKAFAAYSFGAPHRVGMSQFGALGRAKAGQNFEQILGAYYANCRLEQKGDLLGEINVYGYGGMSFEDQYLKGIAEMPTKWADEGGYEALKAQAIAARSYAVAATGNGAEGICATEACQVYNPGKAGDGAAAAWHRAVEETRGKVLVSNDTGQVIAAWYASTSGGFTLSSSLVWGKSRPWAQGIKDVAPGGSWPNDAYEGAKYARSPWFYKAWYHSRGQEASRPSPWLREEELVDILNALQLYERDHGTSLHLSQTDKPNADTWSPSQVRLELQNRGGAPINRVTSISAPTYSNSGFTQAVSFETDLGQKSFSGEEFRAIFLLRAPGELQIKSSLFNVEVK